MSEILAAYECTSCGVEGVDPEIAPNQVNCWNCGLPAKITARLAQTEESVTTSA